MSIETLTRADIAENIKKKCGLPKSQSMEAVEIIIDEITNSLKKKKELKIPLFGVFFARHKKPRIGRNPRTMQEATISERNVIGFRVSRIMKERVNVALKKKQPK